MNAVQPPAAEVPATQHAAEYAADSAIRVPGGGGARRWRRLSLRAKGLALLASFAAYSLCASALVLDLNQTLLDQAGAVARFGTVEAAVGQWRGALGGPSALAQVDLAGALRALSGEVRGDDAALAGALESAALRADAGTGVTNGSTGLEAALMLAGREARLASERRRTRVHAETVAVAGVAIVVTVLGLVSAGVLWGMFFTRLANDLTRLGRRARAVVAGYRGAPLEVSRHDEVGELMQAVNRMARDLERREEELERRHARTARDERMVLVGGIATGLLHEIANPLSAVTAVAGELRRNAGDGADAALCALLEQEAGRITQAVGRLRRLAEPRSAEPGLIDAAALLRESCAVMRFAATMRDVDLRLSIATGLPAAWAVEAELEQVVLALLAVAGTAAGAAGVDVSATPSPGGVRIEVSVASPAPDPFRQGAAQWRDLLARSGASLACDGEGRSTLLLGSVSGA